MKLIFLGTGTSVGVPVIGCKCKVCTSDNPKNQRLRQSVLLQLEGKNILIDASTDLRQQAIKYSIDKVNAILFTHAHADHIFGLDEIRIFNFYQNEEIPCYGNERTIKIIKSIFNYLLAKSEYWGDKPGISTKIIKDKFFLFEKEVIPIEVIHNKQKIFGYRIDDLAYITDCSKIPTSSFDLLKSLDVLIINALRHKPHPAHFNLSQALQAVEQIKPKCAYLTHLSHAFDYDDTNKILPPNVELAYDGLIIET
jgi:phosphoribosyl 1,2-cyclic phosphate phosphodiesterase